MFTLVADSLRVPNGLEPDGNGNLWLVETGFGQNDGTVSLVKPDGVVIPVIVGLPSALDSISGDIVGAWHTLRLPGNKLAVVNGKGENQYSGSILTFDLTGFVPGASAPLTAASSTNQIVISDFVEQNQPPGMPDSNPYSIASDNSGNWYVVDAGFNGIVKVDAATGQKSVFATFDLFPNPTPVGPPVIDPVPTKIIAKPGGGFFVATLTGFPFLDGAATIYSLDANGSATPFTTGLTMVTDLAYDANTGDLYALQFGRFTFDPPPGFVIGSAQVIRIKTDGTKDTVAQNFGPSAGMTLDNNGDLFVTTLFDGLLLKMENVATKAKAVRQVLNNLQISPNPATTPVNISFSLAEPGEVRLRVLDLTGKMVFLENPGRLTAGTHSFNWMAEGQTSGFYFVEIQANNHVEIATLILTR